MKLPDGSRQTIVAAHGLERFPPVVQWSPDGDWILITDSMTQMLVVGADGEPSPRVLVDTTEDLWGDAAWYIPGSSTYTVTMLSLSSSAGPT